MASTAGRLEARLAGIAAAQHQLDRTLGILTDEDARAPSVLPGWTRAHVLTHVARNADAMTAMLHGAVRGEVVPQYESAAAREADIERGARRPLAAIVAEVRESATRLAAAFEAMTVEAWERPVGYLSGPKPARTGPTSRWREVEIHHVDLDLPRYRPEDWPDPFVADNLERELDRLAQRVPSGIALTVRGRTVGDGEPVTVDGRDSALLAWLVGRERLAVGLVATRAGRPVPPPDVGPWG